MECMRKPIYAWAQENPEAFNAKQEEMERWYRMWTLWTQQQEKLESEWYTKTYWVCNKLRKLQDEESPIGCAECERSYRDYCNCFDSDHGFDDGDRDDCW